MSWVERDYILKTGQAGKDSYDQGWAIPIIDALIFYRLNLNYIVRSVQCVMRGEAILRVVCDVTNLTPQQITDLDTFMNGVNNTVIGTHPPRLLDPAITFQRIAYGDETLENIRMDLVGRGLGRQLGMFVGNAFEYWADAPYSSGNKNQLKNIWANRFKDAVTNSPL